MESQSFTEQFQQLSSNLRIWANGITGRGISAEEAFGEHVHIPRTIIFAMLSARGHGKLTELIDIYLNRALECGEKLDEVCKHEKPPQDGKYWAEQGFKSWADVSFSFMSQCDAFGDVYWGAEALNHLITECNKLFKAIDKEILQSDSLKSDKANGDNIRYEGKVYASRELCESLDISLAMLKSYAQDAGIPTPRKGQLDFKFNFEDRKKICQYIASSNSDESVVTAARQIIEETEFKVIDVPPSLSPLIPSEYRIRTFEAERPASSAPKRMPGTRIPLAYRTRILTKAEAARLHAGYEVGNPTSYFKRLVDKGDFTRPMGSGHQWVFNIQDFPPSEHEKLRSLKPSKT
jgi:hypothetical protein